MADLPDPATLTDEELDAVLAGDTPEPDAETAPVQPEEPEEVTEVAEPVEEPEEPEEPVQPEEEPKVSRREALRIQEILKKRSERPQAPQAPTTVRPDALNYEETIDADPALLRKLEDDRTASSQAAFTQGVEQAARGIEWRTMLQVDTPTVMAEHAQMNPKDAENFHPVLTNTINEFYLEMSGFDKTTGQAANPGIRYSDFVDGLYELAEEIASTKVQKAQQNVARQVAKAGLRPDGSTAKKLDLTKSPEQMSDEELDAYLAKALPKK